MIPFRFHLVSLTAVFLALALGVVIGSTVIDRAIVDGLERRIDTVSNNLDRRQAANDRLEGQVDRLEDYVDASAAYTVDGRLEGLTVVVVASRGVPHEQVEALAARLEGADVTGAQVLWLEPSWHLDEEDQRSLLAEQLDVPAGEAVSLRRRAWSQVVEELGDETPEPIGPVDPETPEPDGPPAPQDAPPTLQALVDSGFVTREVLGGENDPGPEALAGAVDRFLVVTDAGEELDAAAVLVPMVERMATAGVATVVAEVSRGDEEPPPDEELLPSTVELVRDDARLRALVATVDNVERPGGHVAAVLALAEVGGDVVGHYGTDDGAGRPLPEPPPQ